LVSSCLGMLLVIMHELDIFDRRDIHLLNRALDR
jgi:hypothetical protein